MIEKFTIKKSVNDIDSCLHWVYNDEGIVEFGSHTDHMEGSILRKKSHLSLAGYIVDVVDQNMITHPLVFRFGSLEPDLVPTFITTKHRIDLTFPKLEKKITRVIQEYDSSKGLTIGLTKDLGVITHYLADYFTFPHNLEYPGTMTEHIHYEAVLKDNFKVFVEEMKAAQVHFKEVALRSAEEICTFIKKCHNEYIHAVNSIQNDCAYILRICAQVIGAILNLLQQRTVPLVQA